MEGLALERATLGKKRSANFIAISDNQTIPSYVDTIRAPFDDWRRGGEGGGQAETGQQVVSTVEIESFNGIDFL